MIKIDFIAARIPRLGIDVLEHLAGDGDKPLDFARSFLDDPAFMRAVYIASRGLHERAAHWDRSLATHQGRRMVRTLIRYLLRASTRCTPFGEFAAVGLAAVVASDRGGDSPCLYDDSIFSVARIDQQILATVASNATKDAIQRRDARLRVIANPTLYRVADRLRFFEVSDLGASDADFSLSEIPFDEVLWRVLSDIRRPVPVATLGAMLANRLGPSRVDASDGIELVWQLMEVGVVLSALSPNVLTSDPSRKLCTELRGLDSARVKTLRTVSRHTAQAGLRCSGGHSRSKSACFKALSSVDAEIRAAFAPSDPDAPTLHIDSFLREELQLPAQWPQRLLGTIDLLRRFPALPPSPLAGWRDHFFERFEEAWVPLGRALDPEFGVPLREHVGTHWSDRLRRPTGGRPESDKLTPIQAWLRDEAAERVGLADGPIRIRREDLEKLKLTEEGATSRSGSFFVHVGLACGGSGGLRGRILGIGGPDGLRMVGRFGHGLPGLAQAVTQQAALADSAYGSAVVAEIVNSPGDRVSNIICRTASRQHIIRLFGSSEPTDGEIITIDDLWVRVADDRIRLWSERLNQEVIPRETNAHAAARPGMLPFYEFLRAVAEQEYVPPALLTAQFGLRPFSPRIEIDDFIIQPAQWVISDRQRHQIVSSKTPLDALRRWRERHPGTDWMAYGSSDNLLLVRWGGRVLEEVLIEEMARMDGPVVLSEFDPATEFVVETKVTRKRCELVLVVNDLDATNSVGVRSDTSMLVAPPSRSNDPLRSLGPGADCLYVKLFATVKAVDTLIADWLHDIRELHLRSMGGVEPCNWFFVRYADPHHHLRLRFFGDSRALWGDFWIRLQRAIEAKRASGEIYRVEIGTYTREVERYGGTLDRMIAAERLFSASSDLCLSQLVGRPDDDSRFLLAAEGLHAIASAMPNAANRLVERASVIAAAFGREQGFDGLSQQAIGAQYRKLRVRLIDALGRAGGDSEPVRGFAQRCSGVLSEFSALPESPLVNLQQSLWHMHSNRLLPTNHRTREAAIYDLMRRAYVEKTKRAGACTTTVNCENPS